MPSQISRIDPHNQQQTLRRLSDLTNYVNNTIGDVGSNSGQLGALNTSINNLQSQVNALPISQGGHVVSVATTGTSVTFPTPFPNAATSVVAIDDHAGGSFRNMAITAISATGFTISASGAGN